MTDTHKPTSTATQQGVDEQHSKAASPVKSRAQPQKEGWRNMLSTVAILLIAPLFALFLITFVFQSYLVDGPSMETTLQNNDRLLVWKVPRTWARITGNTYIPDRGEIVVFTEPDLEDFGQKSTKQLIKRVIGLPGEQVVIKDGVLTVFNKDFLDGFHPDVEFTGGDVKVTPGELNITVPEGHVFVVGDNRSNSLDSRAFGPISADNIVGKLSARFLPFSDARRF